MALTPPPYFANVPADALFDLEISAELFRTLAQLHGLAWGTKGERTPPLTIEDLTKWRGLKVRQMYTHISELKKRRWIRIEYLGGGYMIICPLRWEQPGTALPPDDDEDAPITEAELAALADFTATDCSDTATDCSENEHVVLKHVVVLNSESNLKQQQHVNNMANFTAMNCSEITAEMISAFIAEGIPGQDARKAAVKYVRQFGPDRCQAQLPHFSARCRAARAGPNGLKSPVGLFVRSVEEDWQPPDASSEAVPGSWYSADEADLIQR